MSDEKRTGIVSLDAFNRLVERFDALQVKYNEQTEKRADAEERCLRMEDAGVRTSLALIAETENFRKALAALYRIGQELEREVREHAKTREELAKLRDLLDLAEDAYRAALEVTAVSQ